MAEKDDHQYAEKSLLGMAMTVLRDVETQHRGLHLGAVCCFCKTNNVHRPWCVMLRIERLLKGTRNLPPLFLSGTCPSCKYGDDCKVCRQFIP